MTRLGDQIYRLMLLAFPVWFRQRHAVAMTEQFRAQRQAVNGRPLAALVLWMRATWDVAWNASVVRREGPAPARSTRGNVTSARFAFLQDVRYAARSLRRDLAGTTIIVAILTAGIAANAIMFGIVDQLLLSPPSGVGDPEAVRRVFFGSERHGPSATVDRDGYPQAAAVRDGVEAFEAASVTSRLLDVSLGTGTEARPAVLQLVDASYFPVLGLHPAFGRFFTDAESRLPDGSPVVVLSHGFWRRNYAGDPAIIGGNIRVEGRLMTIVGVGPSGFRGIDDRPVDVWTPVSALAPTLVGSDWATHPGYYQFGLVGRLKSDATEAAANAQATAVYRRTGEGLPIADDETRIVLAEPLEGLRMPSGLPAVGQVSLWLLAVAFVVLLVAIANVAGLLLTRTLSRRREIAVRLALGVSKSRLVSQFVTESALLTGLALTVALGGAWLGGHLVQQVLLPGHSWDGGVVDARVMAVALAMATITVFAVSMAPGLQALSTDLSSSLRTAPRVTGGHAGAVRTGLLVGQVALCVVLLVGAGLFVRSLSAALARDVGMELGLLVHARLPVRPGMARAEAVDQYSEAASRIRQIPGVQGVTITRSSGPMAGSSGTTIRRRDWTLDDTKGRRMPALSRNGSAASRWPRMLARRFRCSQKSMRPTSRAVVTRAEIAGGSASRAVPTRYGPV